MARAGELAFDLPQTGGEAGDLLGADDRDMLHYAGKALAGAGQGGQHNDGMIAGGADNVFVGAQRGTT